MYCANISLQRRYLTNPSRQILPLMNVIQTIALGALCYVNTFFSGIVVIPISFSVATSFAAITGVALVGTLALKYFSESSYFLKEAKKFKNFEIDFDEMQQFLKFWDHLKESKLKTSEKQKILSSIIYSSIPKQGHIYDHLQIAPNVLEEHKIYPLDQKNFILLFRGLSHDESQEREFNHYRFANGVLIQKNILQPHADYIEQLSAKNEFCRLLKIKIEQYIQDPTKVKKAFQGLLPLLDPPVTGLILAERNLTLGDSRYPCDLFQIYLQNSEDFAFPTIQGPQKPTRSAKDRYHIKCHIDFQEKKVYWKWIRFASLPQLDQEGIELERSLTFDFSNGFLEQLKIFDCSTKILPTTISEYDNKINTLNFLSWDEEQDFAYIF
jgi:hypothetical protein